MKLSAGARLLASGLLLLTTACQFIAPMRIAAHPATTQPVATECLFNADQPGLCASPGQPTSPTQTPPSAAPPTLTTTAALRVEPSSTAKEEPTSTPLKPTPCPPDFCVYRGVFFLMRPIQPPGNDVIDVTYRFGSTQSGLRDPHHGVEFLNGYGTPVFAAGDGRVVVAGTDLNPTSPHGVWPITFYGPYSNFYGNLVVIEHQPPAQLLQALPDLPQPIYTLYGHLSEISVQVGQVVAAGEPIGKVGMSGIATGSHLHFEVRLGENTYKASRNPELWLTPHLDANGQPMGAIAGRFVDTYGNSLEMPSIVLQYLPQGPDGPSDFEVTLLTYEEKALMNQPPWLESFAIGDLPAGWYQLSFPMGGLRKELVQVFPGQITAVVFRSQ
jgi:murein DD-endopeptidase MepM/ murein hydrolase activator NlpD